MQGLRDVRWACLWHEHTGSLLYVHQRVGRVHWRKLDSLDQEFAHQLKKLLDDSTRLNSSMLEGRRGVPQQSRTLV